MNDNIHSEPITIKPPEAPGSDFPRFEDAANEAAEGAGATMNQVADATKEAAKQVAETAKEFCHTAAVKAEETLAVSKEYMHRNPVPVLLGAIAVGAALGYMMTMARRRPTFGERYALEPMGAVREALLGAFAPVTRRVHSGYDSALDGAAKAMDRVHHFGSGNSFSHRMGRIGNNLKFW